MRGLKIILIFFILIHLSPEGKATGQSGDILIWKGRQYLLYSDPLYTYPGYGLIEGRIFGDQHPESSTGCVRGYIAEWQIANDSLFLTNIYACYDCGIKASLNNLFSGMVKSNRVYAGWVNQVLLVPDGKLLFYGNIGFSAIHETEYELTINKGMLVGQKMYDNSATHISIFTQKPDSLISYIDHSIRWNEIPDTLNVPVRVVFVLLTTGTTKPEIKRMYGSGIKFYDDEALRVIKSLPDWDMYVQRGEVFRLYWMVPVIFSEEKRMKHVKQMK